MFDLSFALACHVDLLYTSLLIVLGIVELEWPALCRDIASLRDSTQEIIIVKTVIASDAITKQ